MNYHHLHISIFPYRDSQGEKRASYEWIATNGNAFALLDINSGEFEREVYSPSMSLVERRVFLAEALDHFKSTDPR